ncbi:CoA transferase [Arthrobacter tumbae]|uniref:CaiB/BaiF CoA transferase family protein n=1 Tax=Arthrobacter tumbae TaxID=163874 RepID=UPI00195D0DAF|nr:CoA transferase [Arthrobacter tumbae]MBM7781944.1 crotonobetainyl-CoA:carnitine CoA-transferase CaiB-like acyl-CoA transferase [Arthrobacter tumbae]
MSAPLAGIRVLDLTHFVAGPWCTMLLADLGAAVIKLEPPDGEIGRDMGSVYTTGESAIFLGFNRGKRSIAMDLKHPEGLTAALKLAGQADIVVQNFRPGTAERLGIGAAALREAHPELIYCTVSAFGSDGPYASRPANDPVIQALSGSMAATGRVEGRPVRMGVSLPDVAAGVLAVTGILAALHRRKQSGVGSTIELNLLDTQLYAQTDLITTDLITPVAEAENGTAPICPRSDDDDTASVRGAYVCADGLSLWLEAEPSGLIIGAGSAESRSAQGTVHRREEVAALLRTHSRDHWLATLGKIGKDIAPVLGLADVLPGAPPRTLEVDHPSIGRLRQIRTPVTADPSWPPADLPPPRLGEHTQDVLRELGLPDTDINDLAARGIIRTATPCKTSYSTTTNGTHAKEQS